MEKENEVGRLEQCWIQKHESKAELVAAQTITALYKKRT